MYLRVSKLRMLRSDGVVTAARSNVDCKVLERAWGLINVAVVVDAGDKYGICEGVMSLRVELR